MDHTDNVLQRRALKAAKEKARRLRIKPNLRPHEESTAVRLRAEGVSPDAYYSRLRRERLKAERSSDGNSCQLTPLDHRDGNSCRLPDGVSDGNACSPWSPETSNLIRRVGALPGGRDPAFLASLARNIANAPAARAAWGECDPQLAALLAAD